MQGCISLEMALLYTLVIFAVNCSEEALQGNEKCMNLKSAEPTQPELTSGSFVWSNIYCIVCCEGGASYHKQILKPTKRQSQV